MSFEEQCAKFPPGLYVASLNGRKMLVELFVSQSLKRVMISNATGFIVALEQIPTAEVRRATLSDVTPAKGIL